MPRVGPLLRLARMLVSGGLVTMRILIQGPGVQLRLCISNKLSLIHI